MLLGKIPDDINVSASWDRVVPDLHPPTIRQLAFTDDRLRMPEGRLMFGDETVDIPHSIFTALRHHVAKCLRGALGADDEIGIET